MNAWTKMQNLPNKCGAEGLSRRSRMTSLTLLSDSLKTRFKKQDEAAEQKGMSGTTGRIQCEEVTLHSCQVLWQSRQGGSRFVFDAMRRGVQKLENTLDIPSLVVGFSIQY